MPRLTPLFHAIPFVVATALLAGCFRGTDPTGPGAGGAPTLRAYVSTGSSDEVAVIDTVLRRPATDPIKVPGFPSRMVVAPPATANEKSRELLFVLCRNTSGSVAFVNRRSNNVEATVQAGINPTDLAVTSDGAYVYVVSPEERRLRRIDVESRQVDREETLPEDFEPVSVAVRNFRQAAPDARGRYPHAVLVLSRKPVLTTTGASASVKVARMAVFNVAGTNVARTGQLLDVGLGRDPQQPSRVMVWEDAAGTSAFAHVVDFSNGQWMSVRDLSAWQPGNLPVQQETVVILSATGGVGGIALDSNGWQYLSYPAEGGIMAIQPRGQSGNLTRFSPVGSFVPTALAVNGDNSELWAVSPGRGKVVAWDLVPTGGLGANSGSVLFSLLAGAAPVPEDVVLAPGIGR
ncbi:MAG: hypothetical protein VKO21_11275 [Candidatus Sericytochromatia bacterium]|nr:hypothetical protein [Candidatus Sericytochromatia bacterium]